MIGWSAVCSLIVHLVLSSQKIVFQTTCSLHTCWTLDTKDHSKSVKRCVLLQPRLQTRAAETIIKFNKPGHKTQKIQV
jgi:hypothetical protein